MTLLPYKTDTFTAMEQMLTIYTLTRWIFPYKMSRQQLLNPGTPGSLVGQP